MRNWITVEVIAARKRLHRHYEQVLRVVKPLEGQFRNTRYNSATAFSIARRSWQLATLSSLPEWISLSGLGASNTRCQSSSIHAPCGRSLLDQWTSPYSASRDMA